MGIQEEIFTGFLGKLEADKKFPKTIVEELRKILKNGDISSQEKILEAIMREKVDVHEDKRN